jgi:hypothetical protein
MLPWLHMVTWPGDGEGGGKVAQGFPTNLGRADEAGVRSMGENAGIFSAP